MPHFICRYINSVYFYINIINLNDLFIYLSHPNASQTTCVADGIFHALHHNAIVAVELSSLHLHPQQSFPAEAIFAVQLALAPQVSFVMRVIME